MLIKLSKKIQDFLKMGTVIVVKDKIYYYMPFWFSPVDGSTVYQMLTFERLPEDLIESLKRERDEVSDKNSSFIKSMYQGMYQDESSYPAGAYLDPNAPFNQPDDPKCCVCGGETTFEDRNEFGGVEGDLKYICDTCLSKDKFP